MEKKRSWLRPVFTIVVFSLLGAFLIYLIYDMLFVPKIAFSEPNVLENYAYDTPYYVGNVVNKEGFLSPTVEKVRFYSGTRLLTSQDISLYLYKDATEPTLTSDPAVFGGQLISAESEKLPSTPFQLIYLIHVTPDNEWALRSVHMQITFSYFGIIQKDQHYTISLLS
ncbi:hypothetical protein [Zongyangia hominis]|uniref:Uncharacterized protein n=1 Tax=Zongyangia hominis TaxID=2763677 RepID=A0A926I6A2_9FIRM|nr:hypothetical protein [Zongyangia hominis]MBC8569834.1 hypothetical protein [Zongyangia hominis]